MINEKQKNKKTVQERKHNRGPSLRYEVNSHIHNNVSKRNGFPTLKNNQQYNNNTQNKEGLLITTGQNTTNISFDFVEYEMQVTTA